MASPAALPDAEQDDAGPVALAPAALRVRGHEGNTRLHDRWVALSLRRKRPVIANVAVARELSGWCWSLATLPVPTAPALAARPTRVKRG